MLREINCGKAVKVFRSIEWDVSDDTLLVSPYMLKRHRLRRTPYFGAWEQQIPSNRFLRVEETLSLLAILFKKIFLIIYFLKLRNDCFTMLC